MKRTIIQNDKANTSKTLKEAQQTHFIGSWNLENETLCNEIISFFEENKLLQKASLNSLNINLNKKKMTEIIINPKDLSNSKFKSLNNYIKELYKCFIDYQDQWPFVKSLVKDVDIGLFNIQKYLPGDHFSKVQIERSSLQSSHRVLAWMTYLNEVEDGGTTNFSHYDIKVKPETGKTLIWPAEWTHAHSGEVLNSGVKYIVTGWMHFPRDYINKIE